MAVSVHLTPENAVKLVHEGKQTKEPRSSMHTINSTAQCIQNWSETVVVEKYRQDFCSETPLVDTTQSLKGKIHLAMNEHSIVQTEVNLNYTMTVMMQEYRSSAFATSKQIPEELSMQIELLQ